MSFIILHHCIQEDVRRRVVSLMSCWSYHVVCDILGLHFAIEDLELVERSIKGQLDIPVRVVHSIKSYIHRCSI